MSAKLPFSGGIALALSFLMGLAGCGDGPWPEPTAAAPLNAGPGGAELFEPPASPGTWVGDWFPCAGSACELVIDDGYRLGADHTVTDLDSLGDDLEARPVSELRFCVEARPASSGWQAMGDSLYLRGVLIEVLQFLGDRAQIRFSVDGHVQQGWLRRVSGQDLGPCAEGDDTPWS